MVIDFTSPSQLRQFEFSFISDSRKLYVNHYYLAEFSPYFYALCFTPEFKETREKRVWFSDIDFEDMTIFLHYVFPTDAFSLTRKIHVANFAVLIRLSERLMLFELRHRLEFCLSTDSEAIVCLDEKNATPKQLMEILIEAITAFFKEAAILQICKILAKKEVAEVENLINQLGGAYIILIKQKLTPILERYRDLQACSFLRHGGFETIHKRLFF